MSTPSAHHKNHSTTPEADLLEARLLRGQIMTVPQAARRLRLPEQEVWQLICDDGRFDVATVPGTRADRTRMVVVLAED